MSKKLSSRRAAIPYILPYGVFIALLGIQTFFPLSVAVRFVISMAAICAVSLPVLRGLPSRPWASIAVGLITFVIWVGPDVIVPSWHHFILFDNAIMGHPAGSTPPASKNDAVFLFFRIAISVVAVPILEELFWRGWLLRWIEATTHQTYDFRNIPLGQFGAGAFWSVAVLFAVEHGSFWDVGLATGIIFNWWMGRTRNLWDCILMHAVTNAALAAYVVLGGHWQYWL